MILKILTGKIFPEKMIFSSNFDENRIKVVLKLSRLEFDVNVTPTFRVPAKYKQLISSTE